MMYRSKFLISDGWFEVVCILFRSCFCLKCKILPQVLDFEDQQTLPLSFQILMNSTFRLLSRNKANSKSLINSTNLLLVVWLCNIHPLNVFDVDISSSANKIFYGIFTTSFSSSSVQGCPLMEKKRFI